MNKRLNLYKITFIFLIFTYLSSNTKAQDLSNIKSEKPITLNGGVNIQTGFYQIKGTKPRQPGFTYLLNGSPTLNIYGISLPFSFTYSNYQRDFRQPFNQFGLSPKYKWFTAHLGYRNINLSQFVMAGYTILGGGIELNPKKLRFSILYGRSQKAVSEDTSLNIESNLNDIHYPAYQRKLLAVKLGFGTSANYLDFHFLKGKDDSSSLTNKPLNHQILPSENTVLGINSLLSMFKKKLIWQNEAALSVYTRDLSNETIKTDIAIVDNIIKANISTQLYTALESQLNYVEKKYALGLKYRKVTPDYKSMGAYYFQTDFEQLLFNLKLNVLKNKLRFSGGFGNQKDNLQHKKLATTIRTIYNANISYNQNSKFGIDMNLSNYGTSQRAGKKSLSDTSLINQINNSIIITPRYLISSNKDVKSFIVILGKQALDDKNRFTERYTKVDMLFANLIYSNTNLKTNLTYNTGLNYNVSENILGKVGLIGVIAGVSKTLKNSKLNMDGNMNLNFSTFNGASNGIVAGLQYQLSYSILKNQKVSILSNVLHNESKNVLAGNTFTEYFIRLNYIMNF